MFRRTPPHPSLHPPPIVIDSRFQPSQLYSRHRRRILIRRLLISAFAVSIFYAVVVTGTLRAKTRSPLLEKAKRSYSVPIPSDLASPPSTNKVIPILVEPTAEHDEAVLENREQVQHQVQRQIQQVAMSETPATMEVVDIQPQLNPSINYPSDTNFEAALVQVLSLLPDEMHIRELLRPVEGTGKEKLREMGLRAKWYKNFFEAWENLHLVSDGDQMYIRHDIIQHLRNRSGSEDSDSSLFAQTVRSYEAYRYFLQRLASLLFPWTAPYFPDHLTLHTHFAKGGRGIVLTAGDDQATYLLTSIPSFRQLGCPLPIEIMYLGESDLSEDYRAELEALPGVITRDLSQMIDDTGWTLRGWAAKPFAMLMSSFREVIFVDADALFFENPEVLFEDEGYTNTGALFFKDRLMMAESKRRWLQQILPKPISKQVRQSRLWTGESAHMQESGVIVVDKWKHFVALLLVTRMNGPDRDGNEGEGRIGVYDMVYGDKETFWIGWELVGDHGYSFHDGPAGVMGTLGYRPKDEAEIADPGDEEKNNNKPEAEISKTSAEKEPSTQTSFTICAPQLLHLSAYGRPLWFNGGMFSNRFADKKRRGSGKFEAYMKEPGEITEPEAWKLIENNVCCLTNDKTFSFTEDENRTLEMIHGFGIAASAFGKKSGS